MSQKDNQLNSIFHMFAQAASYQHAILAIQLNFPLTLVHLDEQVKKGKTIIMDRAVAELSSYRNSALKNAEGMLARFRTEFNGEL